MAGGARALLGKGNLRGADGGRRRLGELHTDWTDRLRSPVGGEKMRVGDINDVLKVPAPSQIPST